LIIDYDLALSSSPSRQVPFRKRSRERYDLAPIVPTRSAEEGRRRAEGGEKRTRSRTEFSRRRSAGRTRSSQGEGEGEGGRKGSAKIDRICYPVKETGRDERVKGTPSFPDRGRRQRRWGRIRRRRRGEAERSYVRSSYNLTL